MSDPRIYQGKDLEAMAFAVKYHEWILREIRPYLGRHVVEVGAGTGNFSTLLLGETPESITLIEPSGMFGGLEERMAGTDSKTRITLQNSTFREISVSLAAERRPDTIVYVNVLEHIEDDIGELSSAHETISSGGRCIVFVPAFRWLYGEFDRKVGHFRRYGREELSHKLREAGFVVEKCSFFDLAGVLPWFVKYRLLRSSDLGSGAVAAYDRFAVPVMSRIERSIPVPFGKNILAVGKKD